MSNGKTAPPPDGLENSWGKFALDCFSRTIAATGFGLGFSLRWDGYRHVPRKGPVLIVANHQSFLDPPAIGLALPRRVVYLARKNLFEHPVFGALIRGLNAVPIDQDGIGKEGLKTVLGELRRGHAVLVFPEGARSPDGRIGELRPGIHLLIKKTSAPILPVGIAGAYHAWPIWRKYPIPSPLFLPPTERTIAVSVHGSRIGDGGVDGSARRGACAGRIIAAAVE